MGNALTYQKEKIGRNGLVREKPGIYHRSLDKKIKKYVEQLKDFELKCSQPGTDRELLFDEIAALNDSMLRACAQFEQEAHDPAAIKAAQVDFRKKTDPVMSKSYLINRARTWPQGHQGDYMTLEIAYKNAPLSEGIGYHLDKYLLGTALGIGVRERIVKMHELLKEELIARRNPQVLDIACGSCREVFELAPEIKASGAAFTCLDLDTDALDFALDRFAHAGLSSDNTKLIKYNALRMFDPELARTEFGMQDVIYSIGFFDYLPDDFLVKMLSSVHKMLKPGGKLIAAFKDANRYQPQVYHWLVDWNGFLQRTEDVFDRLLRLAKIPRSEISTTRVQSGAIIFYTVAKR